MFRDLLPYVDAAVPFPDAIFSPEGDVQPAVWKEYYLNVIKNLRRCRGNPCQCRTP